jgi:hypothetical protein
MSKKYTRTQGFKPKDEIQIAIIKRNIPGLHGDMIPKVQLVMDEWHRYLVLKQKLVDMYENHPAFQANDNLTP